MVVLFRSDDEEYVLDSFYKLSSPPEETLRKRQETVEALKLTMGAKYLLAQYVEKQNG